MKATFRSILAATDLSRTGNDAVKRAALLAAANDIGTIRALHVTDKSWHVPMMHKDGSHDNSHRLLGDLAVLVRHERGLDVTPRIRNGSMLRVIAAEARHFDLLIIGASQDHSIRDLFLGSTAERLLDTMEAPILVVRHPPKGSYQRVLVAMELSDFDETVIAFARAVAPEAQLDLMHVFDNRFERKLRSAGVGAEAIREYRSVSREQALKEMRVAAERVPDRSREIVVPGPIASTVLRQGRSTKADLIVVGHPKRSWLANLLIRRTAAGVLADAPSDVLVVH